MKKLFLVDAYALIFKYYYAFMGRPMRNRAGMNTSVVFGFTKFLRDIQKREHPDLLGVAFDPKGGSFRREIFPEYKANRAETPEDILLSVPYVKRIVEAMCIPVLEVPGYEADDVIGTLAYKGVEAGYDVFMVTPDKDYGQLVCDNCKIYKQKGNDGIEIVGREAIREKYGIENPQLVRDILALWGDASDNIPGVPGIGEKTACKLVQEWGTVENILQNADRIKSRQGEKIAEWGDKLLLAKRLTTICLDVPIDFREEDLTVCAPRIDELKALFAELDFRMFLNDLTNLAPAEPLPEGPRQAAQTQLAEVARAKSAAAKKAALAGQGDLFAPAADSGESPASDRESASSDEQTAESEEFATAQTTPHAYTIVRNAQELEAVLREVAACPEFCFDTETTGLDVVKQLVAYGREQEKLHDKHFRFTLTTNGVLLNDEIMEFANKEMDNVVLSIDGRKEVHDRMRPFRKGAGSYDLIVPKFQKFAESRHQDKYYVRGTYTHFNTDFSKDVLHLADLGFKQISVEPVVAQPTDEYALKESDLPVLFDEYDRLAAEMVKRNKAGNGFNFFHFMIDLEGGPCVYKRLSGCGSGTEYLAVTPWGDLYPCHQFVGNEDFLMGNVWDGIKATDIQDEFKCCNVYAKEKCRNCFARFYCSGGCAANSYNFHGTITDAYDLGCELQKKRIECAIMIKAAEADMADDAQ
jgi:DNA polymerase-1